MMEEKEEEEEEATEEFINVRHTYAVKQINPSIESKYNIFQAEKSNICWFTNNCLILYTF